MSKTYLGDSVYADFDGDYPALTPYNGYIVLTTENGFGATNTIFLESKVMDALIRYHASIKAARQASNDHA